MALEQQRNDEQRLLTTDEAQRLIGLYAEREQARRAEAERLAAMPKMSDVAGLIGVSPEELTPLLGRLRGQDWSSSAGRSDDDIRMTQYEADRLIELYGQTERERQMELERRAQMTSLAEVAEGLRISVDEAEALLGEVRRRDAPPIRLPIGELYTNLAGSRHQSGLVETRVVNPPPYLEEVDADQVGRRNPRLQSKNDLIAFAIAICCLISLVFIFRWLGGPRAHSSNYSFGEPTPPSTTRSMPVPSTPYTYRRLDSTPSQEYPGVGVSLPLAPAGWTVRVFDSGGIAEAGHAPPKKLDDSFERDQVRACALGLLSHRRGHYSPARLPLDPALVPYSPVAAPKLCSDLAGWMILEVAHGNTIRRVYVPDGRRYSSVSEPESVSRLDYACGMPLGIDAMKAAPRFETVAKAACLPPPGLTITVFAYGRAYQATGRAAPALPLSSEQYYGAIARSVGNLMRHASGQIRRMESVKTPKGEEFTLVRDASGAPKLIVPSIAVNVAYPYGAMSIDGKDAFNALKRGELEKDWSRPNLIDSIAGKISHDVAANSRR